MGKKLIIPGADFSANGIEIPLVVTIKANKSIIIGGKTYTAGDADTDFEIDTIPSDFYLNYNEDVKYIRIGSPFTIPSMGGAFRDLANLEEIVFAAKVRTTVGVANILFANNTSLKKFNAKNLYYEADNASMIFYNCSALTEVKNMDNFSENITNTSLMFSGCSELTSLNLSNLKTANVTDMSNMFKDCKKLRTLILGNGWKMTANPNVTAMFNNCLALTEIFAPSLVASDYNKEGTDTYKFMQGFVSVDALSDNITIHCGSGKLIWQNSAWSVE